MKLYIINENHDLKQNEAQSASERGLISARKTSHKHNNKDLNRLRQLSLAGVDDLGLSCVCVASFEL